MNLTRVIQIPVLLALLPAVTGTFAQSAAPSSMLRIACEGDAQDAEVHVNGVFKGQCQVDVPVPEGVVQVRATKAAGALNERVFEQTLRIAAGTVKRVEVVLGAPQLSARGSQLKAEQDAAARRQAEAAAAREAEARVQAERERQDLQRQVDGGDVRSVVQLASLLDRMDGKDATVLKRSFDLYLRAAEAQDAQAMIRVARRYEYGRGVPKDLQMSAAWYRKAADAGNSQGTGGLAAFAFNGWGPFATQDFAQARGFAEAAAAAKDARGTLVLAMLTSAGAGGVQRDPLRGRQLQDIAAQLGSRLAIGLEADRLYEQADSDDLQARARAIALASRVATEGDDGEPGVAQAWWVLGRAYDFGRGGLAVDHAAARTWYERAASANHSAATFNLAMHHWEGQGGLRADERRALDLFRRSAELGDRDAMNNVGWFYQHGLGGLTSDKSEAAKWYRKAIAAGLRKAKRNLDSLGWFY
jgi:TPR repeat protein